MKRFIDWRIFFTIMAVASLLAFGLHAWIHLNFWVCLGIVVVGILLNGTIATTKTRCRADSANRNPLIFATTLD
jgi:hypothetical protein